MPFRPEEIKDFISESIFRLTLKRVPDPAGELVKNGVLNSITLAELAVELEKKFGISFSFMEVNADNFRNQNSILQMVLQKL